MGSRGFQQASVNFTETELLWYRKVIMILSGILIAIIIILSQVLWYFNTQHLVIHVLYVG